MALFENAGKMAGTMIRRTAGGAAAGALMGYGADSLAGNRGNGWTTRGAIYGAIGGGAMGIKGAINVSSGKTLAGSIKKGYNAAKKSNIGKRAKGWAEKGKSKYDSWVSSGITKNHAGRKTTANSNMTNSYHPGLQAKRIPARSSYNGPRSTTASGPMGFSKQETRQTPGFQSNLGLPAKGRTMNVQSNPNLTSEFYPGPQAIRMPGAHPNSWDRPGSSVRMSNNV